MTTSPKYYSGLEQQPSMLKEEVAPLPKQQQQPSSSSSLPGGGFDPTDLKLEDPIRIAEQVSKEEQADHGGSSGASSSALQGSTTTTIPGGANGDDKLLDGLEKEVSRFEDEQHLAESVLGDTLKDEDPPLPGAPLDLSASGSLDSSSRSTAKTASDAAAAAALAAEPDLSSISEQDALLPPAAAEVVSEETKKSELAASAKQGSTTDLAALGEAPAVETEKDVPAPASADDVALPPDLQAEVDKALQVTDGEMEEAGGAAQTAGKAPTGEVQDDELGPLPA